MRTINLISLSFLSSLYSLFRQYRIGRLSLSARGAVMVSAISLFSVSSFSQAPVVHPVKPKDLSTVEDVPTPPKKVESGKPLIEPKVTIREENGTVIEEYRIQGKLYQQKVKPPDGPAYYLIDTRGEGKFERVDGPNVKVSPPMWVILEW